MRLNLERARHYFAFPALPLSKKAFDVWRSLPRQQGMRCTQERGKILADGSKPLADKPLAFLQLQRPTVAAACPLRSGNHMGKRPTVDWRWKHGVQRLHPRVEPTQRGTSRLRAALHNCPGARSNDFAPATDGATSITISATAVQKPRPCMLHLD